MVTAGWGIWEWGWNVLFATGCVERPNLGWAAIPAIIFGGSAKSISSDSSRSFQSLLPGSGAEEVASLFVIGVQWFLT
jgi:hypothetical protein